MGENLVKVNFNAYNLLIVIFAALSQLSTAYGIAIIASTSGQPSFYQYFRLDPDPTSSGYSRTTIMFGALNGANSGGAFFGAIAAAPLADRFSRKRTILMACLWFILGGALNAGAINIPMLAIGRAIAGVGAGMLSVVVPIYQGEVATAETRGAMMATTGCMWAWGYNVAGWIGYGCSFISPTSPHASAAWRLPLAFQCVPPLIVLLGGHFLPYSPRWLLSKGRHEEAFNVLRRLHTTKSDPTNQTAKEEYYLMVKQYETDKKLSLHRSFEIVRTKANRRRSLLSLALMFFSQFEGIYVVANYSIIIYTYLGFAGRLPLLLNACWTFVAVFGNTWSAFYVDRFGRRPFFLIGTTGCLICLIFLAALTATYQGTTVKAGLNAIVFFIWAFLLLWASFMDATQFVYLSEIWPNHLRAQGTALGIATFFLTSEVTLVAAPVALQAVTVYLILICPTVVFLPILYFCFPETKGRTLEEMGKLFGDKHIATEWYGISEAEKLRIKEQVQQLTDHGTLIGGSPDSEKNAAEADLDRLDSVAGPKYSEKDPVATRGAIDWSPYNGQGPVAENGTIIRPPHTSGAETNSIAQPPYNEQSQVARAGGVEAASSTNTSSAVATDTKDVV